MKSIDGVEIVERVYAKREYWLMLAYNLLKVKLVENLGDKYEEYVDMYRSDYSSFPGTKRSILLKCSLFDEILQETELTHVFLAMKENLFLNFTITQEIVNTMSWVPKRKN